MTKPKDQREEMCVPASSDFGILQMASRLGAAPSKRSFGDSVARLVPGLLYELERLPGIAPGRAPWRGAILLLNHSRGK